MSSPHLRAGQGDAASNLQPARPPTSEDTPSVTTTSHSDTTVSPDTAPARFDVEKQTPRSGSGGKTVDEKGDDAFLVKWDGDNDPDDPLNTPLWRKW
jgi:hypothetical protein